MVTLHVLQFSVFVLLPSFQHHYCPIKLLPKFGVNYLNNAYFSANYLAAIYGNYLPFLVLLSFWTILKCPIKSLRKFSVNCFNNTCSSSKYLTSIYRNCCASSYGVNLFSKKKLDKLGLQTIFIGFFSFC